jgi:hypothetical protein
MPNDPKEGFYNLLTLILEFLSLLENSFLIDLVV